MDQNIPKSDDLFRSRDGGVRFELEQLGHGFAHDAQLSLYRRSQEAAGLIGLEGLAMDELLNSLYGLKDVEKVGSGIKRHKPAFDLGQWILGNRGS